MLLILGDQAVNSCAAWGMSSKRSVAVPEGHPTQPRMEGMQDGFLMQTH